MKFSNNIEDYLNDVKFSNGLTIQIADKKDKIINRRELIIQIIKNKKIVHLGCCDHKPLIKNKIQDNSWLHKHLTENSNYCIGVDIEKDTVDYVRETFNYKNIIYGDITDNNLINEIKSENFDIMVMGEILEHVDNPVFFLQQIRRNYKNYISQILITVPNAFHYRNTINSKNHKEIINSDHRFWFTPYTLAKVATQAGYKVTDFFFTDEIRKKIGLRAKFLILPFIKRKILLYKLSKYPALRNNLIMLINFE